MKILLTALLLMFARTASAQDSSSVKLGLAIGGQSSYLVYEVQKVVPVDSTRVYFNPGVMYLQQVAGPRSIYFGSHIRARAISVNRWGEWWSLGASSGTVLPMQRVADPGYTGWGYLPYVGAGGSVRMAGLWQSWQVDYYFGQARPMLWYGIKWRLP